MCTEEDMGGWVSEEQDRRRTLEARTGLCEASLPPLEQRLETSCVSESCPIYINNTRRGALRVNVQHAATLTALYSSSVTDSRSLSVQQNRHNVKEDKLSVLRMLVSQNTEKRLGTHLCDTDKAGRCPHC